MRSWKLKGELVCRLQDDQCNVKRSHHRGIANF